MLPRGSDDLGELDPILAPPGVLLGGRAGVRVRVCVIANPDPDPNPTLTADPKPLYLPYVSPISPLYLPYIYAVPC